MLSVCLTLCPENLTWRIRLETQKISPDRKVGRTSFVARVLQLPALRELSVFLSFWLSLEVVLDFGRVNLLHTLWGMSLTSILPEMFSFSPLKLDKVFKRIFLKLCGQKLAK